LQNETEEEDEITLLMLLSSDDDFFQPDCAGTQGILRSAIAIELSSRVPAWERRASEVTP
jgi:hypothetical protein